MEYFRSIVELLDITISSKKRRHMIGGGLLSVSLLFGALAITVMTMQENEGEGYEDE